MNNKSLSDSTTTLTTETTQLLPLSESTASSSSGYSITTLSKEQQDEDDDKNHQVRSNARKLLYVSHLLNQFSENLWQFCLVLFLAAFSNYESLVLVCSYGLVSGGVVCWFGSSAGKFIDKTNRLFVAQFFIGLENVCVILCSIFCYLLLKKQGEQEQDIDGDNNGTRLTNGIPTDSLSIFLLIGIHILGPAASVLDSGFIVAVERDWIVVMSKFGIDSSTSVSSTPENIKDYEQEEEGTAEEQQQTLEQQQIRWLSETNVAMKQIDLSCKVVAPAVAGFIVALYDNSAGTENSHPQHGSDLRGAAIFVGLLNVVALVVEYICTYKIYHQIPTLHQKMTTKAKDTSFKSITTMLVSSNEDGHGNGHRKKEIVGKKHCPIRLPYGLSIYFHQPISWAGVSLSLLYLNVLTFGGIMTAYLAWRGMRLDTIGVWRGVSSAAGLAGTFVYKFMSTDKNMGQVDTGMTSVVFQFVCLSISYTSLFIEDYDTSMTMLIIGVCASRIGLWVFDISVTQLMQEFIPEEVRGLVGGVQTSLNAFFQLLSFALGLIFPDPKDFYVYVSVGYAAVGLALVFFSLGVFTKRKQFQNDYIVLPDPS